MTGGVSRLRCRFGGCQECVFAREHCTGHYSQLAKGQELRPLRSYYASARYQAGKEAAVPAIVPRTSGPEEYPDGELYRYLSGISGLEERLVAAQECAVAVNPHTRLMGEIRQRRIYGAHESP